MALGATSNAIMLSFARRGLGVTLTGLAIGVVLASIASRLINTLLYGFRPDCMTTVVSVSVVLVAVAALACVVPVRRAARIDPMIALRQQYYWHEGPVAFRQTGIYGERLRTLLRSPRLAQSRREDVNPQIR